MIKDVLIQDEARYHQPLTYAQLQALAHDARQARAKYAYSLLDQGQHTVRAWFARLKATLNGVIHTPTHRRNIFKGH